jgi:thiosulfate dehydrogenase [quinone] large subunit
LFTRLSQLQARVDGRNERQDEETVMSTPAQARSATEGLGRLPLICVLLIQIFVGYEWFNSGLTKIVRGGFPSGLAADLHDRVKSAGGWYRSFVDGSIIPHAVVFGYVIEIGELLVGIALIAAAVIWIFRWQQLPDTGRVALLAVTILASVGGVFMAVNFHLANGGNHPWLLPKEGFDESVDLDALLPAVQLMFIVLAVGAWRAVRQAAPARAHTPLRLHLGFGQKL